MNESQFKKAFASLMSKDFCAVKGGWVLKRNVSDQCSVGICLFRARWGPTFKFMIKIFIDGAFDRPTPNTPDLREVGDVFRGDRPQDLSTLDLNSPISDTCRIRDLQAIVEGFILPFVEKARTLSGIVDLANCNDVVLLSAVQNEIDRIVSSSRK